MSFRSVRAHASRARARARELRAAFAEVQSDLAVTLDHLAATASGRGQDEHAAELRRLAARARQMAAWAGSDGHAGSAPHPCGPVEGPRTPSRPSDDA